MNQPIIERPTPIPFAAINPGKTIIIPIIKKTPVFLTFDAASINAIDTKNSVIGILAIVPKSVNAASAPVIKKINSATAAKIPIKIKSRAFNLFVFVSMTFSLKNITKL